MGKDSAIEWTHHTFNPWRGCTQVSAGCDHCYAATMSQRNPKMLGVWGDSGTRVLASEEMWRQPLRWNAEAKKLRERQRVFCASLADVFEDWSGPMSGIDGRHLVHTLQGWDTERTAQHESCSRVTMRDVRARLYDLIAATPHLDWLLVTKRPENIRHKTPDQYRPNVWLLTSVETQEQADIRIPELLTCRDLAPVLGLSCEPLLGPVDLSSYMHGVKECDLCDGEDNCPECHGRGEIESDTCLDWVIAGGESGHGARPMHPDWARSLRDQCQAAGVPFFFKQWGEYDSTGAKIGKKLAGRRLDGHEWMEIVASNPDHD